MNDVLEERNVEMVIVIYFVLIPVSIVRIFFSVIVHGFDITSVAAAASKGTLVRFNDDIFFLSILVSAAQK